MGQLELGHRNIRENTMRRVSTVCKKAVVGICGLVLGVGGGCLPDNLFADIAGEIVQGVIISGANAVLAGAGIQI